MKPRNVLPATVLALATATAAAAQGQNCASRDQVIDRLSERYGESRQSIGMAPKGRVIEVFASHETGTWTIIVTLPNGVSCLIASGQSYEAVLEEQRPAGVKS